MDIGLIGLFLGMIAAFWVMADGVPETPEHRCMPSNTYRCACGKMGCLTCVRWHNHSGVWWGEFDAD